VSARRSGSCTGPGARGCRHGAIARFAELAGVCTRVGGLRASAPEGAQRGARRDRGGARAGRRTWTRRRARMGGRVARVGRRRPQVQLERDAAIARGAAPLWVGDRAAASTRSGCGCHVALRRYDVRAAHHRRSARAGGENGRLLLRGGAVPHEGRTAAEHGRDAGSEPCMGDRVFQQGIDVARGQGARLFEERAAANLASIAR
jgi:hypothetical protein